jgi:hypothetical protein
MAPFAQSSLSSLEADGEKHDRDNGKPNLLDQCISRTKPETYSIHRCPVHASWAKCHLGYLLVPEVAIQALAKPTHKFC